MSEERTLAAKAALHDFGTRPGATAKKVVRQMREAGFSLDEIKAVLGND